MCYEAAAVSAMHVHVIVILFFCPRDWIVTRIQIAKDGSWPTESSLRLQEAHTKRVMSCVEQQGSHRHRVCLSGAPPHLACASSHEVPRSNSNRKAASRAELHAEDRSMRQPRAPVSPLEVPTFRATIPAKMITTMMQADRLAADHQQGPVQYCKLCFSEDGAFAHE